jgi:regulation of enolase protein 1 (concanavalin A-like superfamily)
VVTWTTDAVATVSVEAGPTDALEYGSYASTTPATEHVITIPGLSPGRSYRFVAHATNMAGLTATSVTATFITAVAPSVSFESDDFNRTTLEPKPWSIVDPNGDGTVQVTGGETRNARLELTVPGGAAHDTTDTNQSLRVLQAAADIDFTAEIKFEELPTNVGQSTGLLLQQDANNWIVVDVAHDGSRLRARAATTSNGASTSRIDSVARADSTIWMRVVRDGDEWEFRTSANGSSWTVLGRFSFPMAVTAVGPFAANAGAPAPAYTSAVDYLFEGSAPIAPEDQPDEAVLRELEVEVDGNGTIERTPDQDAYVAGTEVRLTAVPEDDAAFTGWGGDLTGAETSVDVVVQDDMSVSATFADDAAAPVIDGVTVVPSTSSAVVSWRTDEPTTASVSVGTSAAFEKGAFGSAYRTRDHSVTVTGLAPGVSYTFAPSSTDAAGHTTTAPTGTFATSGGGAPVIDVWHGLDQVVGGHGRAQAWANVTGTASDPEGVASMSYSLNGGEERPLTVGPNRRRLQSAGDFNADVPYDELNVGDNQVRLTATDASGTSASVTVALERIEGDPSLPYETDWATAGRLQDQAQPVDGHWTVDGDTVRTVAYGYDRVLALGDTSWHDYEVEFPVTINAIGPDAGSRLSGPPLVGFGMNSQGHTVVAGEQPGYFWYPTGALGWYRWYSPLPKFELRGNMDQPVSRNNRFQLAFGTTYRFKGRSETVDGGVEYSWKLWADGAPEPSGWMLRVTEDDGPATGSVILIAHHVDAQFGNVSVRPLDP